jgi:hypothetical protein
MEAEMFKDTNQKLLSGLLLAMRAEHEGEYFYRMAADATADTQGKRVLARLADEEREHAAFLKAQYRAILETGKADAALSLGEKSALDGPSPIFSDAIKGRLENAHYEMTVLAVGAELELAAKQHYASLADDARDPVVKAFYLRLSEWELGHYRALIAQQDELQEEYWAKAGFSPF